MFVIDKRDSNTLISIIKRNEIEGSYFPLKCLINLYLVFQNLSDEKVEIMT